MSEVKSITNILEVIEAIKITGVCGVKVFKDGKVNLEDADALKEFLLQYEKLLAAVRDIKEVIPEAKDLDSAEVVTVGTAAIEAVRAIKAA